MPMKLRVSLIRICGQYGKTNCKERLIKISVSPVSDFLFTQGCFFTHGRFAQGCFFARSLPPSKFRFRLQQMLCSPVLSRIS